MSLYFSCLIHLRVKLLSFWQLFYLFCSSIVINAVIVTAGTFEQKWKREVWRRKIWFNPSFLWKCLYKVRVITVFTVFRLLTDFVCLYNYEFWLSLCKIVRSSVILLLPLFIRFVIKLTCTNRHRSPSSRLLIIISLRSPTSVLVNNKSEVTLVLVHPFFVTGQ